jgi:hypothetical protein
VLAGFATLATDGKQKSQNDQEEMDVHIALATVCSLASMILQPGIPISLRKRTDGTPPRLLHSQTRNWIGNVVLVINGQL